MKHVLFGKWKCSEEGACCKLFSEFTLGTKPQCPELNDNGGCNCYTTRPKVCRVSSFDVEGLDKNEYLIARCHLIHMLESWEKEVGKNASTEWILKKICESGIR